LPIYFSGSTHLQRRHPISSTKAPDGTNRRNPAMEKATRIAGVRDLWKYPTTDAVEKLDL